MTRLASYRGIEVSNSRSFSLTSDALSDRSTPKRTFSRRGLEGAVDLLSLKLTPNLLPGTQEICI